MCYVDRLKMMRLIINKNFFDMLTFFLTNLLVHMASSSRDASGTAKFLKVESFDVLWHPTRTSGGVVPSIPFHPLDLSGLPFVHAGALEVESRSGYKPSLLFSFSLFVKRIIDLPSVLSSVFNLSDIFDSPSFKVKFKHRKTGLLTIPC